MVCKKLCIFISGINAFTVTRQCLLEDAEREISALTDINKGQQEKLNAIAVSAHSASAGEIEETIPLAQPPAGGEGEPVAEENDRGDDKDDPPAAKKGGQEKSL